jgi:hypothetical protein
VVPTAEFDPTVRSSVTNVPAALGVTARIA